MSITQSCLTLCDPMNCSPPGSCVHGILQARILDWVAISFSKGSSQPRDQTWLSSIADRFFTVWATKEASSTNKEWIYKGCMKHLPLAHKFYTLLNHLGPPWLCLHWDPFLLLSLPASVSWDEVGIGVWGTEFCQLHFQTSMSLGPGSSWFRKALAGHLKEGRSREAASHIPSSVPRVAFPINFSLSLQLW